MPRKTRKEKLAAQLHKQRIFVPNSLDKKTIEKKTVTVTHTVSTQSVIKKQSAPSITKDFFDDNVRAYFLEDLRKSLVVISAILLLELTLFLANQAGLLNFMSF